MVEDPLILRFPEGRAERVSTIIEDMQAARLKPRTIKGRDLAPPDINYDYQQRWQAEGRELAFAAEREAQPQLKRGRIRRALAVLFGVA